MDTKSYFLGIRIKPTLYKWLEKEAKENDISVSEFVRQSILERQGRAEALRNDKNEHDVEILKNIAGDTFRFAQTENGFALERVVPKTIILGDGGKGEGNVRQSKTA